MTRIFFNSKEPQSVGDTAVIEASQLEDIMADRNSHLETYRKRVKFEAKHFSKSLEQQGKRVTGRGELEVRHFTKVVKNHLS